MSDPSRLLYLDLLKRSLINLIYDQLDQPIKLLDGRVISTFQARMEGLDWPSNAHTMIGWRRLTNVQNCVEAVLRDHIPGDLIETGVWRGGASILMRGILKAYGITDRTVWLADSFHGLPPPSPDDYPADEGSDLHTYAELAVSVPQVQANFQRYNLLDDQVRFLEGWFKDTLPTAPMERLAVLRLDGDLYESTMQALTSLYPKVSLGGYIIIDDYGAVPACKQAIHDYIDSHQLNANIQQVDWTGAFWQKID